MQISQQVQVGHADSPQPGLKGTSYIFPGKIKSGHTDSVLLGLKRFIHQYTIKKLTFACFAHEILQKWPYLKEQSNTLV